MITFHGKRLDSIYRPMLIELLEEGVEVSPRGMKTLEFQDVVSITVEKPNQSLVTNPSRKSLLSFYFGEFLWMLRGSKDLNHVANYLNGWRRFSDDGKTLNGAYGDRIFNWNDKINQFDEVFEKLNNDKNCRQAVISIYNPEKDLKPTLDVPCNDFLQFYVRNDKLCCTVYQRSCDIISGLTYDMHMFATFQALMAGRLGLEVGNYTHIANSLHLYERDFEMAKKIVNDKTPTFYDDSMNIDYRLTGDYHFDRRKLVFTEEIFRNYASTITEKECKDILDCLPSEDWKSALAVILIFNLRKANRKEESKKYYSYLRNEFAKMIPERWQ